MSARCSSSRAWPVAPKGHAPPDTWIQSVTGGAMLNPHLIPVAIEPRDGGTARRASLMRPSAWSLMRRLMALASRSGGPPLVQHRALPQRNAREVRGAGDDVG